MQLLPSDRLLRTLGTVIYLLCSLVLVDLCRAADSPASRKTLAGLKGVYLVIEDLQPNILKYSAKSGLTVENLRTMVAAQLRDKGVSTFTYQEWLNAPGRPALYVNINTHQTERYWFAFDIRLELQQLASLEANPSIKTLAPTWSVNMTGVTDVASLHSFHQNIQALVDVFLKAYSSENRKR